MAPLAPFQAWSGPHDAQVVLVGEAWGESEAKVKLPFAGESGKELWRMLGEAWPEVEPEEHQRVRVMHRYDLAWVGQRKPWLEAARVGMTNVLALRPPGNQIEQLCGSKAEGSGKLAIRPGKYLLPQYLTEVNRLEDELQQCQPNLVIALGNTACWALLNTTSIGSIRGAIAQSHLGPKVLPTYHPAAMLRQWSWRPIIVADLIKAGRERLFSEIRRPKRQVLVDPSLSEVRAWVERVLASPPPLMACDIETGADQIKCIGFAQSISDALVIPFVNPAVPGWSYWSSSDERQVWELVQQLLARVPLVFQNGLYDLQYLLRMGLRPQHCSADTMLLHHSLWPELQKGLGFLGSIYTNEASWKLMRRQRPDSEKRDE